ncbi:MAG: AAA family ATPase [Deltaproteobacteria bacterium]|nr:AAA family ATPase [Deltaproteobacteria bacterium]
MRERPEYRDILERCLEAQERSGWSQHDWELSDVGVWPGKLARLLNDRIVEYTYRSRSTKRYRLVNPGAVRRGLELAAGAEAEAGERVEIPDQLFDVVVGYDPIKRIILRGLRSEKPVHFLLWGPPATAKSLMLDCIKSLPNSVLVLGSSLTKVGIRDVLMDNPRREIILCLDEIEKVDNPRDLDILLRILQTGELVKTIHGTHEEVRKRVWAVGTANRIERLSPELRSRFVVLRFREYTDEEFVEVSKRVLTRLEGASEGTAAYIADRVLRELKSRDVRDCAKVFRLGGESREQIDEVIRTLRECR